VGKLGGCVRIGGVVSTSASSTSRYIIIYASNSLIFN